MSDKKQIKKSTISKRHEKILTMLYMVEVMEIGWPRLDYFQRLLRAIKNTDFKSIPQWKKYEDRIKKLMIIKEIKVFDWKDEADIQYMFKYSCNEDWNIYNIDSGDDSFIYVIANNKPTIAQLKEASDIFQNFTQDTNITQETRFPYSTGYYDEEEKEEKDDRTKLQEVSGMFEPLDRWFKKEEEKK